MLQPDFSLQATLTFFCWKLFSFLCINVCIRMSFLCFWKTVADYFFLRIIWTIINRSLFFSCISNVTFRKSHENLNYGWLTVRRSHARRDCGDLALVEPFLAAHSKQTCVRCAVRWEKSLAPGNTFLTRKARGGKSRASVSLRLHDRLMKIPHIYNIIAIVFYSRIW